MSRPLLRQGVSYSVIGLAALLLDWLAFVALSASGVATVPANLCGRVAGAVLSFFSNGALTFRGPDGSRLGWSRMLRYVVLWCALAALSTAALTAVEQQQTLGWAWIAKPFVDALLAALAFVISRAWVYR